MSLNESLSAKPLLDIQPAAPNEELEVPAPVTPNPNDPPWGVFGALSTWIVSIVLLLLVPVLLIVPYVVYLMLNGGSAQGLATDPSLIFLSILGVLPAHALTLLVVWYVVTKWGRRPFWQTLGWSWPSDFGPWKTVALAIALFGVGWLITHFLGGAETQLDQIIKSSYKARLVTAVLAAVSGPFVEELIYRGVLYPALQRAIGVIGAVIIVSVLFTGVHVLQYINNFGVIAVIAILSIALTVVRARTGRLLPSYIIHLVFNGIQAILLIVQPFFDKPQLTPQAAPGFLLQTLSRLLG